MKPVIQIDTQFQLKKLAAEDASALFSLTDQNRAYLRQWLGWLDKTRSVEDSAGYIAFADSEGSKGTGIVFGIWNAGVLAGVCNFHFINKANRSAGIGYWVSEDQAGQGIARTATKALLAYGFSELDLHRIEIRCAAENIASQKVAESCGLKYEGHARSCEWLYDHFVDHKVYSILRTDV